jgi:hypothetical protein
MTLLGRTWANVAPVMKDYATFAAAAAAADPISQKKIDDAHKMGVEIGVLNEKLNAVGVEVGTELLPATQEWVQLLDDAFPSDGPLMTAFKWLDGFLIRAAQGFHIVGEEMKANWQLATGDVAGSLKTTQGLNTWMQKEDADQWFRDNGWYKNKAGQWTNPAVTPYGSEGAPGAGADEAAAAAAADAAAKQAEAQHVTDLTAAYKAYEDELKKVNDEKQKRADDDLSYYEDVRAAGRDATKLGQLALTHAQQQRTAGKTLAGDESTLNENLGKFVMTAANTPQDQIPGTTQFNQKQAVQASYSPAITIMIENLYPPPGVDGVKLVDDLGKELKIRGITTGNVRT